MNAPLDLERARFYMIEQQIRPWDVLDLEILDLLSQVHREDFVPLAHKALAFVDMQIPLGGGACMLEPKVEARLVQDLKLSGSDKVLEVGTGTGYMAALMARRAQRVITLEIDPALAKAARENLQRAGITNAEVREADGSGGLPNEAPFDAIVLSGSVAEVPAALLAQLKVGGRLMAITGSEPIMRATLITRTGDTSYSTSQPWDINVPRLKNFPEASRFSF